MADIGAYLDRKYAVLEGQLALAERERQDRLLGITAAANYQNTQNKLLPAESAAEIALRRAQTGLTNTQSKWYGPEAQSQIDLRKEQGRGISADVYTSLFRPPDAAPQAATPRAPSWFDNPQRGSPGARKPRQISSLMSTSGMPSVSSSPGYNTLRLGWLA